MCKSFPMPCIVPLLPTLVQRSSNKDVQFCAPATWATVSSLCMRNRQPSMFTRRLTIASQLSEVKAGSANNLQCHVIINKCHLVIKTDGKKYPERSGSTWPDQIMGNFRVKTHTASSPSTVHPVEG